MDLKQLRYFVMVAEELSFVRAARRLHMSQPPLSHQIKALEEELGVELLFRNQREVRLTDAGRVFLRESRDLLERAQAVTHRTRQAAGGEEAALRIGMATSALFHVLPELLRRMAVQFPHMEISLTDMNSDEQVRGLAVDRIDLGFIHARKDLRGLKSLPIVADTFAIALPATHRLAAQDSLCLLDMENEPVVAFSREHAPALFDALISSCRQQGFSPRIAHVARHPASLLQMIRMGLGVSIIPRAYASHPMPGLVFRQLPPMAGRLQIDAIWREGNPAPGLGRVISEVLSDFHNGLDGEPGASNLRDNAGI